MNTNSVWNKKKYQRAVNHFVRDINKNIANDWVWNGRFVVSQKEAYFKPYPDHSGANFVCFLACLDTKTNRIEYRWFNNYNIDWDLWRWVNDCITQYFDVWSENPDPYEQARLEGRICK